MYLCTGSLEGEFSARLQISDEIFESCQSLIGFGGETWVSNENSEAMNLAKELKSYVLKRISDEDDRAKFDLNWFLIWKTRLKH